MNSTYTIIDNFDKLDVSWTDDYRMDNIYIADGFLLADSLDKLSIEGNNKNSEAINPIDNSITLPQGDELVVQNYPNHPLSFGRTYAYMPDMLRFVIGNRFYVGANDFLLHYPNHINKDTFEHYKSFGIYKPIAGPPAWYFDFFDCPNQIDNNSWYFNNEIRFKDYFLPKNYDVIPALKESDFSSYSKVLEQLASQKSIFHRPEVIEAGNPVSAHLYPFFIPKYNNGTNNNGAPGVLGFLKYSTMYPNLEFENGNTTEEQLQAVMPVVKPTLENLLLFEITNKEEFLSPDHPTLPWKWRPWHLYFVTDLPKGSHSKPEDPDLKKLFNIVEMESKYNYYLANAESSAENIISERQMPNLYTYFSYVNDNLQDIFYYDNLINLGQGKNLGEKSKFTVSKYYDTVATSGDQDKAAIATTNEQGDILALPLNVVTPLSFRYKNIIIANTDFLKSANAIAKNFPMYNKITLPLISQKSDFMEIVKANGETKTFISLMANYFSTIRHPRSSIHTFAIHNNKSKLTQANLQIMDITPYFPGYQGNWFWQDVAESFKDFFNDKDNVMFGGVPILDASMEDIEVTKFQNVLSKAETHFSQNKRSFIDIYNGKKCHTEILAYEIVKSKIIGGKKEHIQSIFIPVIEDEVAIPYIDTQVFYNQEYVYEIYTHSLVIGTQYQINYDFEAGADLGDELAGPLINDSSPLSDETKLIRPIKNIQEHFKVIVIRAPYYNTKSLIEDNAQLGETQSQQTALILDKPPLPPDIVFHPYKDNDDKILILLNINSGERYMYAQPVFIEDYEAINKLKKVYPPTSKYPPGYLPFKNDDGAKGEYLIYKMTQKPTNWKDFVNAQIKTISTEDQTGYNDFIAPNVDYYYFARFRDIHGNLSNPTDVFHIRLVKEGGFPPYLITDVYNFDQGIAPTYEKSFKKYVKIGLQDGVRVLEGDKINTATVGYSKLGNNNTAEPKKYKVRITSKKTGKKVDINLEYSNTTNTDFINGLVPVVGELGEGIPAPLK